MKSNEIRVGNLVADKEGAIYEADHITIAMAHNYLPIPLTEDWLKRFGFYRSEHFGLSGPVMEFSAPEMRRKALYHHGTIYYQKGKLNIEFINEHGHYACIDFLLINYVHQLQNLYFALTGKELDLLKEQESA